ncbi:MAG: hypothetical protein RIR57_1494 [Bacteroidota bacterium]|jgi:hypothetical protein
MILAVLFLFLLYNKDIDSMGQSLSKSSCNRLHTMSNFKTDTKKVRIN